MPEELMLRCDQCGLVFNKITYPECPRCRHVRRRASPAAGGDGTGVRGGGRGASGRGAALLGVLGKTLVPLAFMLAGAAVYVIALNVSQGRSWNDAPLTVMTVPRDVVVYRTRAAAPGAATAVGHVSGETALTLGTWTRRTLPEGAGLEFEGTLSNTGTMPVDAARARVVGLDEDGREVASDWDVVTPSPLEPGASGSFRLRVGADGSTTSFRLDASWTRRFETSLVTIPNVATP